MNVLRTLIVLSVCIFTTFNANSQNKEKSDIELITEVLNHYIEGTANGEPDLLKIAFHPDFNLYTTKNDSLWIRSGEKYVSNIKKGKKSSRVGRIISIDYENNAASAKAEIIIPNWRVYTDYFLLLKYQGSWKIVQKSYSYRTYSKKEKN
ncbi:putative lumazine-binding protein [Lutibacter sp. Hel_I_33_5]|uniref:nuclear transport factor 2 family protein n=1 Tax=Lutibacter sp. Hel_I_33_5 TaxID=1566289 RepID=UPI00119EC410|nr:nuclear transport factor 2 family protein [Lutibacter sp. Hel_I_33_5]TVZ55314.1 putative lumazine-binding protein [Lutibacter sp. Hel_I_33_5]